MGDSVRKYNTSYESTEGVARLLVRSFEAVQTWPLFRSLGDLLPETFAVEGVERVFVGQWEMVDNRRVHHEELRELSVTDRGAGGGGGGGGGRLSSSSGTVLVGGGTRSLHRGIGFGWATRAHVSRNSSASQDTIGSVAFSSDLHHG